MPLPKLIVLLLLAVSLGAASVFSVSIDTHSLPTATSGYLDLLFSGVTPASVSVTGFTTDGTLDPASVSSNGANGTLPGAVSLANINAEYLEGITFGSHINFNLQFAGTGAESVFTLSLLNATQDDALLTSNVNDGFLLEFNIDAHGVITPITFSTASGGPSVVSIVSPTAVPEPAQWLPAIFGLLGIVTLKKRKMIYGGHCVNNLELLQTPPDKPHAFHD
jgi:hypothetical protein